MSLVGRCGPAGDKMLGMRGVIANAAPPRFRPATVRMWLRCPPSKTDRGATVARRLAVAALAAGLGPNDGLVENRLVVTPLLVGVREYSEPPLHDERRQV